MVLDPAASASVTTMMACAMHGMRVLAHGMCALYSYELVQLCIKYLWYSCTYNTARERESLGHSMHGLFHFHVYISAVSIRSICVESLPAASTASRMVEPVTLAAACWRQQLAMASLAAAGWLAAAPRDGSQGHLAAADLRPSPCPPALRYAGHHPRRCRTQRQ
jgi:hypothetical protein